MNSQLSQSELDELIEKHLEVYLNGRAKLEKMVPLVVEKLENALAEEGILAKVSGRVKTKNSLRGKLRGWAADKDRAERLSDDQDVFHTAGDLAAVRVMTYMETDRDRVTRLIPELFANAAHLSDFDKDKKDEVGSQKQGQHYRATHMQIALKASDTSQQKLEDLKTAHCELQITSMLAHVWNEIEHDFFYKADKNKVSDAEKQALDSLGMLTRTGDNIITNLIEANQKQNNHHEQQSERFKTAAELENFLVNTYQGLKLGKKEIVLTSQCGALFSALKTIRLDHPKDLLLQATPRAIVDGYPTSRDILKLQSQKQLTRSVIKPHSCDAILVALLPRYSSILMKESHGLNREVAIAKAFAELN